jgi:hypothetical protein
MARPFPTVLRPKAMAFPNAATTASPRLGHSLGFRKVGNTAAAELFSIDILTAGR